jgi:long-subunit fatty acid transport protein
MSLLYKIIFLLLIVSTTAFAQGVGNSPYSQIGIGDINSPAFVPAQGMGGTGASYSDAFHINYVNPALLGRNKTTIFEVGVNGQYKKIQTNTASQKDVGGNLSYLAFAFPVAKRWTISAGLRPYSTVGYEIKTSETIPGLEYQAGYTFKGSGGLTSVDFTNGFHILSKPKNNLYVGIKASYIFGNITRESVSQLNTDSVAGIGIAYVNRTNYSDVIVKTGIAYRRKLKDKLFLNAGFVYDFQGDVQGKRFIGFQARDRSTGLPLTSGYDTLYRDIKGSVRIPAQYRFGLSIDRPFNWALTADFSYQNWSDFKDFQVKETLNNSYTLAVGGEIIPDITSVSSYFKRMTYRAGVNFSKTPISLNGEQLNDFGINFGTSLPVGRGISDLNLAFTWGQRGTLNSNLIKEQYFKVSLGFTLNGLYDGWFVKQKID